MFKFNISMSEHVGTHIDAPYHFNPKGKQEVEKRRGRVSKCPAVSHHLGASNPRYDLNTATS